jgi:hypothetical protein
MKNMKMIKNFFFGLAISSFLLSCIGEDIIADRMEESVKISTTVESLKVGTTFQLEATYLNEVGQMEEVDFAWVSSNKNVISITSSGLIEALTNGTADITLSLPGRIDIMDVMTIEASNITAVIMKTERNGSLQTTSSYALSGDFNLVDTGAGLELRFASNFIASSSLPGLYVYLTNNINTNNGALEISRINTFTGAQTFTLPSEVKIDDYSHVLFYCKPFSVKVGDGVFEN